MNKKFLNKVLGHIVKETIIDYEKERIDPFIPRTSFLSVLSSRPSLSPSPFSPFARHCIAIYGLTMDEVDYIWHQYRNIIKDKINEQEVSK
jgi:hypothetical protein